MESNSFVSTNSKIIELSNILNRLPIHKDIVRKSDFRNPNGVAMKLSNFAAIDPDNPAKGLTRFSQLDKQTFIEFQNKRNLLKNIADVILESLKDKVIISQLYEIEDNPEQSTKEAFEGEIIFKLHKLR